MGTHKKLLAGEIYNEQAGGRWIQGALSDSCLLDTRGISKDATHNFERKATISIFGFNQITIGYAFLGVNF